MHWRCMYLAIKQNKYHRFVRNRPVCVCFGSWRRVCVICHQLTPWDCTSPYHLMMPLRNGLSLPLGFLQAFSSTFKVHLSGVSLFLFFSVWLARIYWATRVIMFGSLIRVFHWNTFIMMWIWQINVLTLSCWTTSHYCYSVHFWSFSSFSFFFLLRRSALQGGSLLFLYISRVQCLSVLYASK